MAAEQHRVLVEDFRGLVRAEHPSMLPLYLWIADDKVAIFSIPTFAPGAREAGFLTRDSKLIAELRSIFDTYETGLPPVK